MRPRSIAALAAYMTVGFAQAQVSIVTAKDTEREQRTKAQLERLLEEHDVGRWIFTTDVVIDETSIPHSHPVLTLHTRHLDEDLHLLSTFVHEQIHWHLSAEWARTQLAIDDLRGAYPTVPVGGREGGRDAESTYLHLLVNSLEYDAMRQLIGEVKATEVMEFWTTDHYTWIYRTVLSDGRRLGEVIRKFGLGI
jgi:hypothetical protein